MMKFVNFNSSAARRRSLFPSERHSLFPNELAACLTAAGIIFCTAIICGEGITPLSQLAETHVSSNSGLRAAARAPKLWGEDVPGVMRRLETEEKVIALTLDICGGKNDKLDRELVNFLAENDIPATFFINYRWIRKNPEDFAMLAENTLFEIENHGTRHIPASVSGMSAYGIRGTASPEELRTEVLTNADEIESRTGVRPKFFRSGTAYYDEKAAEIILEMGFVPVGFSVLGDGGATFGERKVFNAMMSAKAGDIIIAHVNKADRPTGRGIMAAIPELLKRGFTFVRLGEH